MSSWIGGDGRSIREYKQISSRQLHVRGQVVNRALLKLCRTDAIQDCTVAWVFACHDAPATCDVDVHETVSAKPVLLKL
jgi:hypothetical protein